MEKKYLMGFETWFGKNSKYEYRQDDLRINMI